MWEPRRLTTLWAFTACYGIALQIKLNSDLGKQMCLQICLFLYKNYIMYVYSTLVFHIFKWRYIHTKLICFDLQMLIYFIIYCQTRFITFYYLFCISDLISVPFSTSFCSLQCFMNCVLTSWPVATRHCSKNTVEHNTYYKTTEWNVNWLTLLLQSVKVFLLEKILNISMTELWYSGQCSCLRESCNHWWWKVFYLFILCIETLDADLIVQ
jgi:hypothetical protein